MTASKIRYKDTFVKNLRLSEAETMLVEETTELRQSNVRLFQITEDNKKHLLYYEEQLYEMQTKFEEQEAAIFLLQRRFTAEQKLVEGLDYEKRELVKRLDESEKENAKLLVLYRNIARTKISWPQTVGSKDASGPIGKLALATPVYSRPTDAVEQDHDVYTNKQPNETEWQEESDFEVAGEAQPALALAGKAMLASYSKVVDLGLSIAKKRSTATAWLDRGTEIEAKRGCGVKAWSYQGDEDMAKARSNPRAWAYQGGESSCSIPTRAFGGGLEEGACKAQVVASNLPDARR